jgi:hypothetical protein
MTGLKSRVERWASIHFTNRLIALGKRKEQLNGESQASRQKTGNGWNLGSDCSRLSMAGVWRT